MALRVVENGDRPAEAATPDEIVHEAVVAMRKLERAMLEDRLNDAGRFEGHGYSAIAASLSVVERMAKRHGVQEGAAP